MEESENHEYVNILHFKCLITGQTLPPTSLKSRFSVEASGFLCLLDQLPDKLICHRFGRWVPVPSSVWSFCCPVLPSKVVRQCREPAGSRDVTSHMGHESRSRVWFNRHELKWKLKLHGRILQKMLALMEMDIVNSDFALWWKLMLNLCFKGWAAFPFLTQHLAHFSCHSKLLVPRQCWYSPHNPWEYRQISFNFTKLFDTKSNNYKQRPISATVCTKVV